MRHLSVQTGQMKDSNPTGIRADTFMKQISAIWVGNPFFKDALIERGWRVHWINPVVSDVLDWNQITAAAGFVPDSLIVADKSLPPFVTGMETFPCLTTFYAVDTHIHSWFPLYAQGFDSCMVSLKDHLPLFAGNRLSKDVLWWSPAYANPKDEPRPQDPQKPSWDVIFVGTADPTVNPDRCMFLKAVAERIPGLHVERGDYRTLYPQAKIVLNHAASNDLNFRVFEALGCGACLVTPFVRHGLEDIFQNGEDLFIFDQNDVDGLAKLLKALLAAPVRREKVAAQGHATVHAGHYAHHRATAFAERIENLIHSGAAATMIQTRIQNARQIHSSWLRLLYLHHAETTEKQSLRALYLKAART